MARTYGGRQTPNIAGLGGKGTDPGCFAHLLPVERNHASRYSPPSSATRSCATNASSRFASSIPMRPRTLSASTARKWPAWRSAKTTPTVRACSSRSELSFARADCAQLDRPFLLTFQQYASRRKTHSPRRLPPIFAPKRSPFSATWPATTIASGSRRARPSLKPN